MPLEPLPTDETHAKLEVTLQPHTAPAELSTEERTRLIAEGDCYLHHSLFLSAKKAYRAAGAADRLIALGDRYLQDGHLRPAQDAYEAAGQEIPKAKLVAYIEAHCRS